MIGIYFSGTGNTKYCLEKFVALYDRNIEITPLEDEVHIPQELRIRSRGTERHSASN